MGRSTHCHVAPVPSLTGVGTGSPVAGSALTRTKGSACVERYHPEARRAGLAEADQVAWGELLGLGQQRVGAVDIETHQVLERVVAVQPQDS